MSNILASIFAALTGRDPPKVRKVSTPAGAVRRNNTSLFQQRGWQRRGKSYSGPFATKFGTWSGKIEDAGSGFLRVFIKDPPMAAVDKHPKRPCFYCDQHGWWRINLATPPVDGDVNAVIHYVERVLTESFQRAGKS